MKSGMQNPEENSPGVGLGPGLVALLALLAGLFYQTGEPVWDDQILIVEDLAQRPISSLPSLWTETVGGSGPGQGYYRPLSMSLLALLGSTNFWLIHLASALLHASSTCMVMLLLREQKGPLLAGLCFGLHPLASEVLGWASALPDALAVFLALAGVLCMKRSLYWSLLLCIGAVASKETGLLVLVFLIAGFRADRKGLICLGVSALALVLPRLILGVETNFNIEGRQDMLASAVAWPMTWLAWPLPLTVVHDLWMAPDWVLWGAPSLGLVMLFAARHDRLGLLGFGLCVAAPLVALMPSVSGLMVAERYMYPALLGFAIWVGVVVPVRPWTVRTAAVGVILSLGVHLQRAAEWQNDRALFYAAAADAPRSALSQHFKSVICKREGDWICVANISFELLQYGGPGQRLNGPPPNEVYTLASFMEALVEIGRPEVALQWAEGRPEHAMDNDYFIWAYVRAAMHRDQHDRARRILNSIKRPEGWTPPGPLAELMAQLASQEPSPQLP
jgi:hypothetical protein